MLPVIDLEDAEAGKANAKPAPTQPTTIAGEERPDLSNYLARLKRTMSQVTALLAYEPADVASVIDAEFKRAHIDTMINALVQWAQQIGEAMPDARMGLENETTGPRLSGLVISTENERDAR